MGEELLNLAVHLKKVAVSVTDRPLALFMRWNKNHYILESNQGKPFLQERFVCDTEGVLLTRVEL